MRQTVILSRTVASITMINTVTIVTTHYHLAPFFFFPPRAGLPGCGFCCRAAELALDDGVVVNCTPVDVPGPGGFGELTELPGGDDVDGLLASLPQSTT